MTGFIQNGKVKTFCRICDPVCGLVAQVEDGKIVNVEPNPNHVLSQGHRCKKSSGMVDITYDPDRVLQPMKRVGGPGEFEPVSWDDALTDIANRLKSIRDENGKDAFGTYLGNPPALSSSTMLWLGGFKQTLETRWNYCVNAEDFASYTYANYLLFGSGAYTFKPDLWRSDFVLLVGSNPAVSHGSLVVEPLFRDALSSVIERGGRVVVVDPRKTETASRYEHVGLIAGTDAWLLGAMLNVVIENNLVDLRHLKPHLKNFDAFAQAMKAFTPEKAEAHCSVPAAAIEQLALDFAQAKSAVIWGRSGLCQQKFGTLGNFLLQCLNIITGNFDRVGGSLFGWGAIDFAKMARSTGLDKINENPSRSTGLPDVNGLLPSAAITSDILEPGEGQLKALMMIGANPILNSTGTNARMAEALDTLELFFSLDLYINESNRFADYVLPACGFYEREDIPLAMVGGMLRPTFFTTPAVIPPMGESRPEWHVMQEICQRMGYGGAYPNAIMRFLAKMGLELKPRHLEELLIRTGETGDWFGLRPNGISVGKTLRDHPDGVKLADHLPTGVVDKKIYTDDKKIDLLPPEIASELEALPKKQWVIDDYPLRMHSQRKPLSHNSWMHNARSLAPGAQSCRAMIHPLDAANAGIKSGDEIIITSANGQVQVPAEVSESMTPGNVALPHGWGHKKAGWQHANTLRGVNSNILASDRVEDMEQLSGMAALNGIPINIRPAEQSLEAVV